MLLREVEPADIPVLYEHQADAESSRLAAVRSRNREEHAAHMAKVLADPQTVVRAIVVDDAVAGEVLSFPRDGVREVGYRLGREFWGRGLATAALREFLPLLPERPLYGVVAEHNPASRRVLERNGFRLVERREPEPGVDDVVVLVYRLD